MGEFIRDRLPEPGSYFADAGLTLRGQGKWKTTGCVFHDGSDSMRINTESGGWVCMACGEKGGDVLAFHMRRHELGFVAAATALGAYIEDAHTYRGATKARRLPAADALELLYQDALLVWVAAGNTINRLTLSEKDMTDLTAAMRRILLISQEAQP